jgi:tetratricopeptide (TPR) repeat protein
VASGLLITAQILLTALFVLPFAENKATDLWPQDPQQQAAALFEAGQKAHQSGDLAKAVEYYGEALKLDPGLWPAEFQRSVAFLSLGHVKEASTSIESVLRLLAEFSDSEDLRSMTARAHVVRGEIALAESRREDAESAYRRALELQPKTGAAHAGLAELLLDSNRIDEAITEAKAAIASGDDRSSTWTVLGAALVIREKHEEAIASLNEAIARNPRQGAALRSRAEAHIALRRLPEAVRDLRAAIELEPDTLLRLRLAEVYARNEQYPEAIELLQAIVSAEPDNSDARTQMAAAMINSGRAAEAIAALEKLVAEQPSRAELRARLAELYLGSQPEKALEQYSTAARLEPGQPRHQLGIATAMVRTRRFEEATPLLRSVLAANPPEDVTYFAHTNLATALFEMDDYSGAAAEYLWILRRQQQLGDRRRAAVSLYLLGICFDKLGDFEQALKAYENFLQLASTENQLEIDKVKLRLPSLKRQIQEGQGKRRKN